MDKYFWRANVPVAFNPLQIDEGMSQGLQELTEQEKQTLLNPIQPDFPEKEYKHFTGQDKLDLFTESEQAAIMSAAYSGDIQVIMVYERFKIANYLTYSDERTQQGLALLKAKGLVTPERYQEIIAVMTAEREV